MDNYAIYLRKSRADAELEKRGQGETLARHRAALTELAKKLELNITKVYEEIVSGESIVSRPQMQELMRDVEQGKYTGVLVMEIERLARGDTIDQGLVAQTFKYSHTKIITPLKTYDPTNEYDEEFFEFGLFMSRREYKTINRRLQQGRAASVREGKFVGSVPPYGYKKVPVSGNKGFTLEIVEEQAAIVRMIYDLYVNGIDGKRLGVQLITKRLNDLKIPALHDKWEKSSVRNIIDNPVYCGLLRWGHHKTQKKVVNGKTVKSRPANDDYILVDGMHPPIISKEIYDKVQELKANRPVMPVTHKNVIKNPLSSLIRCKICGRRMVLRKSSDIRYPDYIICSTVGCENIGSKLDIVEKRLIETLKQWIDHYELEIDQEAPIISQKSTLQAAISAKDKELDTLNNQLKRAYDLLEQSVYTINDFAARKSDLSERIEATRSDLDRLSQEIDRAELQEKAIADFIPHIKTVLQAYQEAVTPAAKNELLREILEKAVYCKTKSGVYRDMPCDEFELELYPRLPENI